MHAEVQSMNVNEAPVEEILPWVRSVRAFMKRARKNINKDIRNMLMAKTN